MTATWTVVHPGRPVTIGVPLPTYSVVVLDPDSDRALPPGEMGEIGIAGIGLASGYLNRPDLTERAFVPDFLGIPDNPPGRIYRTGDLGRLNADGEIEHHGRIDTQVKIRGYRIELTEIESVLLRVPGIAQAVVSTYQPAPDVVELAAYYSARRDTPARGPRPGLRGAARAAARVHGPGLPGAAAGHPDAAQRQGRPQEPARAERAPPSWPPAATTWPRRPATERALAEVLATVLAVDRISADSHFFDDLGASSLLMARFSAAIRERGDLPPVSMKDIYLHPTVRQLAAASGSLAAAQPAGPAAARRRAGARRAAPPEAAPAARGTLRVSPVRHAAAAGLRRATSPASRWRWTRGPPGPPRARGARDLRAAGGLRRRRAAGHGHRCRSLAKWLLIGRWKPRRIRAWSLAYFRFWLVKTMIVANPLARLLRRHPAVRGCTCGRWAPGSAAAR